MLKEFRDFVMRGNVVELAVAVIIGAAFGAVITAFAAAFITPLIALIGGKPDFGDLAFTISGTEFPYGQFLNALISFLIIAAVVFFFVVQPDEQARWRGSSARTRSPTPRPAEVATLLEIRDLLATQRGGRRRLSGVAILGGCPSRPPPSRSCSSPSGTTPRAPPSCSTWTACWPRSSPIRTTRTCPRRRAAR